MVTDTMTSKLTDQFYSTSNIKFEVDLRPLIKTWIMLGECAAKCEQIAAMPILPETAAKIETEYLARAIGAVLTFEGVNLESGEIRRIIEHKAPVSDPGENVRNDSIDLMAGFKAVADYVREDPPAAITPERIRNLHKEIMKNRLPETGNFRTGRIKSSSDYEYPSGEDVSPLLECLCQWLDEIRSRVGENDNKLVYGILAGIIAHINTLLIFPFTTGTPAIARFLEFEIFLRSGLSFSAALLPGIRYTAAKSEYFKQFDIAIRTGDIRGFISYAVKGLLDGLNEQLRLLRGQYSFIAWTSHIDRQFTGKENSKSWRRRKWLILDLSSRQEPATLNEIRYITPRIARAYRQMHPRTVSRDLDLLADIGLVAREKNTFYAKRESLITSLQP